MQGTFHSTQNSANSKTGANFMEISWKKFPKNPKTVRMLSIPPKISSLSFLKFPVANGKAFSGISGKELSLQIVPKSSRLWLKENV